MLELAASRTPGINHSIAPLVRQLALQDWYVAYELQVRLQAGESLAGVRSILHGYIQDVFSEFGVQIMSPNFVSQPDQPVIVTRPDWFTLPAKPDTASQFASIQTRLCFYPIALPMPRSGMKAPASPTYHPVAERRR